MKEIGGYFGLEKLISNEYYNELIALNTGRNALLYLINARRINKLFIPWYLCNSISDMLKCKHYSYEYYSVDQKFMPIFNKELDDNEFLFLVNYYGQLTKEQIMLLKEKFKNIILDNTQAFFQKPIRGIDTIYSCRKYFGVPDGAYLATETELNENLEVDISKYRMTHILGRFEGLASEYYDDFKKNDFLLRNEELKYMSKLTHNILGAIDYKKVCKSRNENYIYLHDKLKNKNKLKLIVSNGPFAYPFYIENGITIRQQLAEKKVYIPILWPNVLEDCPKDSHEYDYAANILPLPCDQRYEIEDMENLLKELKICID
jgi:hypothetical protein